MRTISIIIALALMTSGLFAGMIMGTLNVPGTPTDTAYVFVFHDFTTLMDTSFFYTLAFPPDYNYIFDDPFILDGYDYNVMALIPSGLPPASGDPAGQYPGNPFRISGGIITGVDVELARYGGVQGTIIYSGSPDSLKMNIFNQYPMLLGGGPTLDGTWLIDSLVFELDSVPSGAKSALLWSDLNGNGLCDTTGFLQEPHAHFVNELDGIFVVGGGANMVINFNLDAGNVTERIAVPSGFGLRCFPNPFNSAMSILLAGNGDPIELAVYDMNGKLVEKIIESGAFTGYHLLRFTPSNDLPTGAYMVKAASGGIVKTQTVVYMK